MNARVQEMEKDLCDPVGTRRREALRELEHEWSRDEVAGFCSFARTLTSSKAFRLCEILAEASLPELVDVLGSYAGAGDETLRHRAVVALESVPASSSSPCLVRLLDAKDAVVRENACRLLGGTGDVRCVPDLLKRLKDGDRNVVIAALDALRRLRPEEGIPEVSVLFEHPDEETRVRAVRAFAELAPAAKLPWRRLAALLGPETPESVRVAAAWALGVRPTPGGKSALLDALANEQAPVVRAEVAAALGAYSEEAVAHALLTASSTADDVSVSLGCQRALNQMQESVVLAVCGRMLAEDDIAVQLEAAAALGGLSFEGAPDMLSERLKAERRPLARAAIVEALGRIGRPDAWDMLRPCMREDLIVAYAAASALGGMLNKARLDDYVALLAQAEEETLQEALLKRLALYGRSRELPGFLTDILTPILGRDHRNTAVLAAEIFGDVRGDRAVDALLDARLETTDAEIARAASGALLAIFGGDAMALAEAVGDERQGFVAEVIAGRRDLGDTGAQLCRYLAEACGRGAPGAWEALSAAAGVEPACLPAALGDCSDAAAEAVVRAWREQPDERRAAAPIDLRALLRAPGARVRAAALQTLDSSSRKEFLVRAVDMALGDTDIEVREQARQAARRIAGA